MKAREVFEKYPDANWLAMDGDKCVCTFETEPKESVFYKNWINDNEDYIILPKLVIAEFLNKPWTACKISRTEAMKDDCCEWHKQGDYPCYITSCKASDGDDIRFEFEECKDQDYKYCPYCGKKIKEVTK